jgi:hypothetical protein
MPAIAGPVDLVCGESLVGDVIGQRSALRGLLTVRCPERGTILYPCGDKSASNFGGVWFCCRSCRNHRRSLVARPYVMVAGICPVDQVAWVEKVLVDVPVAERSVYCGPRCRKAARRGRYRKQHPVTALGQGRLRRDQGRVQAQVADGLCASLGCCAVASEVVEAGVWLPLCIGCLVSAETSCCGKRRHADRPTALEHAAALIAKDRRRHADAAGRATAIYRCFLCRSWHVGRAENPGQDRRVRRATQALWLALDPEQRDRLLAAWAPEGELLPRRRSAAVAAAVANLESAA